MASASSLPCSSVALVLASRISAQVGDHFVTLGLSRQGECGAIRQSPPSGVLELQPERDLSSQWVKRRPGSWNVASAASMRTLFRDSTAVNSHGSQSNTSRVSALTSTRRRSSPGTSHTPRPGYDLSPCASGILSVVSARRKVGADAFSALLGLDDAYAFGAEPQVGHLQSVQLLGSAVGHPEQKQDPERLEIDLPGEQHLVQAAH
ncbi:hypothetical protein [Saccharopolyspora hattusasensis]|uniref:hypothetical protein n=1 Tax=Saccharopolyspora hattusasensis TaxID=1128679 RepID=UPI003D9841CE